MKIKNFWKLAQTEARRDALSVFEEGLKSIDTEEAVKRNIRLENNKLVVCGQTFNLKGVKRLVVAGIGKCSSKAAEALNSILEDRIGDGIIIDVHCGKKLKNIEMCEGTHPFPSEKNVENTARMIELLKGLGEEDLAIIIVSGGGSTLLCQPDDLTCFQETDIVKCLFEAGANIREINTIRKHISMARGGALAAYSYPARVIGLVFSDVVGDDMSFIASGPTVWDGTTVNDAEKIKKKYSVAERCGFKINFIETPKDKKFFGKVSNFILMSNKIALAAMQKAAMAMGYSAEVRTNILYGEAREVGKKITKELKSAATKKIMLYGGETTVSVHGHGKGGRSQELALSALTCLSEDCLILAAASDGRDNGDNAGAISDILTKRAASERGLDPAEFLERNDSASFFAQLEQAIITGYTGSNVADFVIALKQ